MSSVPAMAANWARLRVAIFSSDLSRVSVLAGIVLNAGHNITDDGGDADVVIADGSVQHPDHPAVIKMGDVDDRESAGVLPKSATPEQIDVAIRAAAIGLSVRLRSAASERLRSDSAAASTSAAWPARTNSPTSTSTCAEHSRIGFTRCSAKKGRSLGPATRGSTPCCAKSVAP